MSDGFRLELNHEGVRELLQSAEMMAACEKPAQNALERLGEEYGIEKNVSKTRVAVTLAAKTPYAYHSNLKHNHILREIQREKTGEAFSR